MALFQGKHKKSPKKSRTEEAIEEVDHFFDDDFREQLKSHGRIYFEKVINENAALFKQDLDATIEHVNTELSQHMARQIDERFAEIGQANTELREHIAKQYDGEFEEYQKTLKGAQEKAMFTLEGSESALQEKFLQLASALEKSIARQDAMMARAFQDSGAQINEMKQTQDAALQSLNQSAQELKEQHQQIAAAVQKNVAYQVAILVNGFEENMASIIEHYLLDAVGDSFDLKSQLPSIIKSMETNKEALLDDMKL